MDDGDDYDGDDERQCQPIAEAVLQQYQTERASYPE
jgi:hypothetical protein